MLLVVGMVLLHIVGLVLLCDNASIDQQSEQRLLLLFNKWELSVMEWDGQNRSPIPPKRKVKWNGRDYNIQWTTKRTLRISHGSQTFRLQSNSKVTFYSNEILKIEQVLDVKTRQSVSIEFWMINPHDAQTFQSFATKISEKIRTLR